jgi:chromosome segregation ATPase
MLRLANVEAAIDKHHGQLGEVDSQLQRLSASEAGNRALLTEVSEHMPPAQRASLEAAVALHQAQLGRMNERLGHLIAAGADERVSREMAAQRQQADLEALTARLEGQEAGVEALKATIEGQQGQVGTLSGALQNQQAEVGSLNMSVQVQQSSLGTVSATVQQQQSQLAAVSSELANHRTQLAEVAQHLPPAQRANLEATLHGQQLQLGALNSTIHANQIQLGALNDITQRLTAEGATQRALLAEISAQAPSARLTSLETALAEQQSPIGVLADLAQQLGAVQKEKQALADKITTLERENRLLRVGHGATFEELASRGKVSTGAPYRFDDLLSLRQTPPRSAPTVPPLIFVHVPKAGGTTLNNILMKNYRYRMDSYADDFFPRYYPDEFVALVQAPINDDTRRPAFFTGHIDLANEIFRYMPVRYVAITMLRDPVQRIVSHYRFHSTLRSSPLAAEIANGKLGLVEYFKRFRSTIPLQYEMFAPRKSGENEEDTGRGAEALRNLEDRISFFGLQDNFDEFVILLAELLGLPDVLYVPLNKTPANATKVSRAQIEQLRELLADDIAFYDGAVKLYQRRAKALTFDLAARVSAFRQEKNNYLEGRKDRSHPWAGAYS